jgi:hypothetical protein
MMAVQAKAGIAQAAGSCRWLGTDALKRWTKADNGAPSFFRYQIGCKPKKLLSNLILI